MSGRGAINRSNSGAQTPSTATNKCQRRLRLKGGNIAPTQLDTKTNRRFPPLANRITHYFESQYVHGVPVNYRSGGGGASITDQSAMVLTASRQHGSRKQQRRHHHLLSLITNTPLLAWALHYYTVALLPGRLSSYPSVNQKMLL